MARPGRKSAASLAVAAVTAIAPAPARPAPPDHLSAAAARAWREIAGSRPAGYFDAALHALEVLATAMAEHRRLAELVAAADPGEDPQGYGMLVRLLDGQALRVAAVCTKLRLTPQATLSPRAASRAAEATTPADRIRAAYRSRT